MQNNYEEKYLKYKKKYLDLKNKNNLRGGYTGEFWVEAGKIFAKGVVKGTNQIPKLALSSGQAIANSLFRLSQCDKNDQTKNLIISNIKNILSLLKDRDTKKNPSQSHQQRFLQILNLGNDTSNYKNKISLLIQIFQSIKDKKIKKDYTSYALYSDITNGATQIMYIPPVIKEDFDYITMFMSPPPSFEGLVQNFCTKIGENNIESIIKYLKEIRGQIDCYCKIDFNTCKLTFEDYLKNPNPVIIQTPVQVENKIVKNYNDIMSSFKEIIEFSYGENDERGMESLGVLLICIFLNITKLYYNQNNTPLVDLIKSNISNLILFLRSTYEDNIINTSNIQDLFNIYKINMIEIKGRNTEDYIKRIENIIDSLNSMSTEFTKCSGGNNYEEQLKKIKDCANEDIINNAININEEYLKIIKDENEAQTSALVKDQNEAQTSAVDKH